MSRKSTEETAPASEAGEKAFSSLGLDPRLVSTLDALGYEEPTPIQRESIPTLLEGRDFVGQAATGTGKTAAFALPMLQRIAALGADRPQPSGLVLVPTRELAAQVAEAVHRYGRPLGISVLPIFGGAPFGQQLRGLERGVDVVVATPGRALDHISRETLLLDGVSIVVLDEADEMLDMGFAEDLEAILSRTPAERQTVLFSATLPPRIAAISKRHLRDPVRIQIAREAAEKGVAPKVRQTAYVVQRAYKLIALSRILDLEDPGSALVFCRTRLEVDELTEKLAARGYRAQALHGGISQDQRTRVIKRLRGGEVDLVIATDVAARGLDIENLSHVINYDVPANAESYVHRIGRVGRAGREGVAITLFEPRESRLIKNCEQIAKHKIPVSQVPTLADLKARKLEQTRVKLQETLLAGGLDDYRAVVDALAAEFNAVDVALAAVKLAHLASGGDVNEIDDHAKDIPAATDPKPFAPRTGRQGQPVKGKTPRERREERDIIRLYFGAGAHNGVSPSTLVGAMTGQTNITGKDIGRIEIGEFHSVVEVPLPFANRIIKALNGRIFNGKKAVVRRFKD